MNQLPKYPSKLIRVALRDLIKTERSRKYKINMAVWHLPLPEVKDKLCAVCFAGSVMAQTLKVPLGVVRTPIGFDQETSDRLMALDLFRTGALRSAMMRLYPSGWRRAQTNLMASVAITPYERDPKGFKKDMRLLADAFEEYGY